MCIRPSFCVDPEGQDGTSCRPRRSRGPLVIRERRTRAARSNRRGDSGRLCVPGLPSSSQAVRNSSWGRVSPTLVPQARAPGSLHGTHCGLVAAADARENASRQPTMRLRGSTMRPPTFWTPRLLGYFLPLGWLSAAARTHRRAAHAELEDHSVRRSTREHCNNTSTKL